MQPYLWDEVVTEQLRMIQLLMLMDMEETQRMTNELLPDQSNWQDPRHISHTNIQKNHFQCMASGRKSFLVQAICTGQCKSLHQSPLGGIMILLLVAGYSCCSTGCSGISWASSGKESSRDLHVQLYALATCMLADSWRLLFFLGDGWWMMTKSMMRLIIRLWVRGLSGVTYHHHHLHPWRLGWVLACDDLVFS